MGPWYNKSVLISVVGLLVWSGTELAVAETSRLRGSLTKVPGRWQAANAEEGPIVGVWRVLTGAPSDAATAVPLTPRKKTKPEPLTIRDYLNQQRAPTSGSDTLLQYGF